MNFNPELCHNESEVENQLIVNYLLPKLGYAPDTLYREVTFSSIRLNFLAVATQMLSLPLNAKSPLRLVVRATPPHQSLERYVWQPKLYLTNLSVPYAVLTNGQEIRIYQKSGDGIELVFQCAGAEVDAKIDEMQGIIGREILEQKQDAPEPSQPEAVTEVVPEAAISAATEVVTQREETLEQNQAEPKPAPAIAPEEISPQDTSPQEISPEDTSPQEISPEDTSPEDTSPEDTSPQDTSPEDTSPQEISPQDTSPEDTSPQDTSPQDTSPQDTSPQDTSPEDTSPQEISPEPNSVGSESVAPDWQVPENENLKVIAVYHNKGGVGKTTTTLNLAAALSKKGKRVLVIDLDSQANTTFATTATLEANRLEDLQNKNILHVLRSQDLFPISEVAITSKFSTPEIDAIPSNLDLVEYEAELNQSSYSRVVLLQKLAATGDRYDIVIIDTPPALNLYVEIALIAANYLIIPSDLKPFSNQGLLKVKQAIAKVNEFKAEIGKPPIVNLGVMACKISTNASFRDYKLPKLLETISQEYGFELMKSIISERVDFSKSMEETKQVGDKEVAAPTSVLDYKPKSPAAKEIEALANEVLRRIEN